MARATNQTQEEDCEISFCLKDLLVSQGFDKSPDFVSKWEDESYFGNRSTPIYAMEIIWRYIISLHPNGQRHMKTVPPFSNNKKEESEFRKQVSNFVKENLSIGKPNFIIMTKPYGESELT